MVQAAIYKLSIFTKQSKKVKTNDNLFQNVKKNEAINEFISQASEVEKVDEFPYEPFDPSVISHIGIP